MLGIFMYILEIKKELLVGVSLSILYITYYLVEVVKVKIIQLLGRLISRISVVLFGVDFFVFRCGGTTSVTNRCVVQSSSTPTELCVLLQKPILICSQGDFRRFLEESVPLLSEHYWPTPWCVESRLQTVLGSILRSRLLPPVKYRRYKVHIIILNTSILKWWEWSPYYCEINEL